MVLNTELGGSPNPDIPMGVYGSYRPVKAIIVGAGIGGIATACILSKRVQNLSYVIYDKNDRVGGTWAENIYPGVRCDVPSHVYQLTFAPNSEWSEYYSRGHEIQQYYERVCETFGLTNHTKLLHRVTSARWDTTRSEWEVQVQNTQTGETLIDRADIFIAAQGRTNEPSYPAIPNLGEYQGLVVHTAKWKPDINLEGKRVAVIGNGASGQQIIPNILHQVDHIDHYVRSKTYVTPTFRDDLVRPTQDNPGAYRYTEQEKNTFREDPAEYLEYRKSLDKGMSGKWYELDATSAAAKEFRKTLLDEILRRVNGDQEWLNRLSPDYDPGCKRLTPGAGYIESLLDSKVEYIDTAISQATATGLQTSDSTKRDVDIIIAATGFKDGFYPRFPTIGKNGRNLAEDWKPDGKIGYPATYLGVMAPDAPNYFTVLQAQGNAFGGSVPLHCEATAAFIARVIRKLQRDGYVACSPSQEATDDFNTAVDEYFANSVVQSKCNSWFKLGGGSERIVVGWPGTTRHRIEVLAEPRWEDFNFERKKSDNNSSKNNRFWFWHDGKTVADRESDFDVLLSHQKQPAEVDFQTLHDSAY